MVEPWSDEFSARVRKWCDQVAVFPIDVLADAGLVAEGDFKRASDIVGEESFVRLCLRDYPPIPESLGNAGDPEPLCHQPPEP